MSKINQAFARVILFLVPFLIFFWLTETDKNGISIDIFQLTLLLMSFVIPFLFSLKGWGGYLIVGTIIALVSNVYDLIIKVFNLTINLGVKVHRQCSDLCGFDNYLIIAVLVFYLFVGLFFFFKEKNSRIV